MMCLTVFDLEGKVNVQKSPILWDGLLARLVVQIRLSTSITSGGNTTCPVEQPTPMVIFIPPANLAVDDNNGISNVPNAISTGGEHLSLRDDDDNADFEPDSKSGGGSDGESKVRLMAMRCLAPQPQPPKR
jgi:hypothetical protein